MIDEQEPIISIQNLKKQYEDHPILDGLSFEVMRGDLICIIGRSGCGKSTLLRCMNCLEVADEGEMKIAGITLDFSVPKKLQTQLIQVKSQAVRKKVGMVFQNFNLFPHLTVLENVTIAQTVVQKSDAKTASERARASLEKVGLQSFSERYPDQLSGGQQQRAAIARALALSPEIMLYDEPTSALDPELVDEVLQVMRKLDHEGMTQIVVTHEMRFAKEASDRIIYLESGKIVETQTPELMFSNPTDDRTRQFLRKFL